MKKIISTVLCILMIVTMAIPAFAVSGKIAYPSTLNDSKLEKVSHNNNYVVVPKDIKSAEIEFTAPKDASVYIWFEDTASKNKNCFSIFMTPGRQKAFAAPAGCYNIQYAYGDTWYGPEYLFGSETKYIAINGDVDFSTTNSNGYVYYSSWTVSELSTDPDTYGYTYEIDETEFKAFDHPELLKDAQ